LLAISLTFVRSMAANPRGRRGFWGSVADESDFGVSEALLSGEVSVVGSRTEFMFGS